MPEQKPLINALEVSVLVDRRDQPGQVPWTEWRTGIVLTGGTPAQAGDLALLGPNGKFDPSVIPGGSGGSTVSVNGTTVTDPNFNNTTPAAPGGFSNVIWQFDGSGNVSAYYQTAPSTSFTNITSGTNTLATMTVGTGASIGFSGTGTIDANLLHGTPVSGTAPTTGQALVFNGTSWAPATFVFPQTFTAVPHEWINSYSATTGLFTATQPSASDLTNGVTGTGAVVLAGSPTVTGTLSATNVAISGTLADSSSSTGTSGYILSSTGTGTQWIPNTSGGTSFTGITSGTNTTATMTVGTGATLTFSGTGVVNASEVNGVSITNTPSGSNEVLVTTSTTTAQWQAAPSSSGNFLQALVDFGSDTGPIIRSTDATVAVAAPWVTPSSVILCTLAGAMTPQHGPDDGLLEGMTVQAESLVAGVGFTIHAYSPLGSWGKYAINAVGL